MTSKMDTAGLVERLRAHADSQIEDDIVGYIQTADDLMLEAADFIEALTQAAAPDMKAIKLPPLGEELYEFYPAMSAGTHEAAVKEYARSAASSQLSALQERAERAERERDEAHQVASKLTKALVGLTPGGSEYFTRCEALDDYFADVDQCVRVIRERFDTGHQAKIERVDERRRAEAAEARVAELEKQRDEARHELWETGLALGVIAKWPRVYFNRFYVEEWVLRTVTILKRWGVEFADGPLSVEGSRSIRNSRLSRAALAHKGE